MLFSAAAFAADAPSDKPRPFLVPNVARVADATDANPYHFAEIKQGDADWFVDPGVAPTADYASCVAGPALAPAQGKPNALNEALALHLILDREKAGDAVLTVVLSAPVAAAARDDLVRLDDKPSLVTKATREKVSLPMPAE